MALSLNPTKAHPPSIVACAIIVVIVLIGYHLVAGHKKAG